MSKMDGIETPLRIVTQAWTLFNMNTWDKKRGGNTAPFFYPMLMQNYSSSTVATNIYCRSTEVKSDFQLQRHMYKRGLVK